MSGRCRLGPVGRTINLGDRKGQAGGGPLDGRVRPRAWAGSLALGRVKLKLRKHGRRVAARAGENAAVPGSINQLTARRSTVARSANNKLTVQAARSANHQLTENIATFRSEATARQKRGETTGNVSSELARTGRKQPDTSWLLAGGHLKTPRVDGIGRDFAKAEGRANCGLHVRPNV